MIIKIILFIVLLTIIAMVATVAIALVVVVILFTTNGAVTFDVVFGLPFGAGLLITWPLLV